MAVFVERQGVVGVSPKRELSAKRELLSAFVICFNEEDNVQACLESLSFCDEIVVIDSFSTDQTVEIARNFGATVIERKWQGFRDQKSFGLSQVSHQWVLNIDADERVTPELRLSIEHVLRGDFSFVQGPEQGPEQSDRPEEIVGFYANRVVYYLGRWWRNGGWYPEYRLRLFRKNSVTWGGIDPHEKPIPQGKTARLVGELEHYTYRNMDEQFQRLDKYSSVAAKEEFRLGRKFSLRQLFLNPILRFVKFYVLKKGYREGVAGLIVAVAEGYYTFMKYAKLWELHFEAQRKNQDG